MENQKIENKRLDNYMWKNSKAYEQFCLKQEALKEIAMYGDAEDMARFIGQDKPLTHSPSVALMKYIWNYMRELDLEFLLITIGMKRNMRRRFLLGWANIRRIDNLIDSHSASEDKIRESKKVIENIKEIEKNKYFFSKDIYEKILQVYVLLEKQSELKTLDSMKNLSQSAEIDILRKGKILTWKEYNELIYYKAECTTEFWIRFLLNRNDELTKSFAHHFGILAQYIDDVLDFNKDLNVGIINITKEEIEKFEIDNLTKRTPEQIEKFCNYREFLICEHCSELLKSIEKVESYYQRRLLKSYVAFMMQNTKNNSFYPDAPYSFPFASFYRWLLNTKNPAYESLFQILGHLSVFFPIGKIPTEPSYVRNNDAKKR